MNRFFHLSFSYVMVNTNWRADENQIGVKTSPPNKTLKRHVWRSPPSHALVLKPRWLATELMGENWGNILPDGNPAGIPWQSYHRNIFTLLVCLILWKGVNKGNLNLKVFGWFIFRWAWALGLYMTHVMNESASTNTNGCSQSYVEVIGSLLK